MKKLIFSLILMTSLMLMVIGGVSAVITEIEVISPNGGEYWGGVQDIKWTWTGDNGEDTVDIVFSTDDFFDSQFVLATDVLVSSSPFSWNTNTSTFPDGDNYKVRFFNGPQLVYDTSNVAFTIDNTDPVVTINAVTTPTNVATQLIEGTFTEINIDTITVNGVGVVPGEGIYSATIGLFEGSNDVIVIATDLAGNTDTEQSLDPIVLDTTGPTINVLGAPEGWLVQQGGVTATIDCVTADCVVTGFKFYNENPVSCSGSFGDYTDTNPVIGHKWVCAAAKDSLDNIGYSSPQEFIVFETIQNAINAAEGGEIINVGVGTYTEDLTITTDNLELVGADKTTTIIKGVANVHKDDWPLAVPNIDIQADGVEIHGFTIEGPDYVADYYASGVVLDGQDIEIYDNDFVTTEAANTDELAHAITTYSKTAIPLADVSGLNIHDNTFTGSGDVGVEAIYINPHAGIGKITIENNQFSGSVFVGVTAESGNVDVTSNEINSDIIGKGLYGIRFMDSTYAGNYDNILISGNDIQNFVRGIRVGNGGDGASVFVASILSNTLSNNDVGIWTRKGSQVTATYNLISGNTVGIQNDIATVVNAEINYWGAPNGPSGEGLGDGDAVSANVDYTPWAYNENMDVDEVEPVTTDSGTDNVWHNSEVTVALDCDDADSSCDKTYYCVDQTNQCTPDIEGNFVIVSAEGENYVRFYSVDFAGNVELVKTAENTVKIDKTNPETSDSVPAGWQNSIFSVTLTVVDDTFSPVTTYYKIWEVGETEPTEWTQGTTISIIEDGEYNILYYSVDEAGNVEEVKTSLNAKLDTVLPSLSVQSISQIYAEDFTLQITESDGTSGLNICEYRVNSGSWLPRVCDSGDTPLITVGAGEECSSEDICEVEIRAIDNAGNERVVSETFSIDWTNAPLILSSGPSGTVINKGTTLYVETNKPATCRYDTEYKSSYDAMNFVVETTGGVDHSHGLIELLDKQYAYYVLCKDNAENEMTQPVSILFDVDTRGEFSVTIPETKGDYLSEGWNQFFLPSFVLADTTLTSPYAAEDVLESIEGSYEMVYHFDGTNWKTYDPLRVTENGEPLNDLTEFDMFNGGGFPYFINMNVAGERIEIA